MAKVIKTPAIKLTARQVRIAASRKKLTARIEAKHPKSKAYKARLAEYDASDVVWTASGGVKAKPA